MKIVVFAIDCEVELKNDEQPFILDPVVLRRRPLIHTFLRRNADE
jgi:hypothetical protein